jgi:hypothetical protein
MTWIALLVGLAILSFLIVLSLLKYFKGQDIDTPVGRAKIIEKGGLLLRWPLTALPIPIFVQKELEVEWVTTIRSFATNYCKVFRDPKEFNNESLSGSIALFKSRNKANEIKTEYRYSSSGVITHVCIFLPPFKFTVLVAEEIITRSMTYALGIKNINNVTSVYKV